jgi:hypothetical protein
MCYARDGRRHAAASWVHFGTTGGTLYASSDGGTHWKPIAEGLPRIQSVEVSVGS